MSWTFNKGCWFPWIICGTNGTLDNKSVLQRNRFYITISQQSWSSCKSMSSDIIFQNKHWCFVKKRKKWTSSYKVRWWPDWSTIIDQIVWLHFITYFHNFCLTFQIGAFAAPDKIHWAPGLPKTRSGKIMRRILRKIASRQLDELGDTSTLAEPNVVTQLIELADSWSLTLCTI